MSELKNNYLSIANNDYLYVKNSRNPNFRNNTASLCEQVIEKLLKSIVQKIVVDNVSLLRSHNLRNLYNSISDELVLDENVFIHFSMITDFYFDARYPGDDFVIVSESEEETCIQVMDAVYTAVNDWHSKYEKKQDSFSTLHKINEGN